MLTQAKTIGIYIQFFSSSFSLNINLLQKYSMTPELNHTLTINEYVYLVTCCICFIEKLPRI